MSYETQFDSWEPGKDAYKADGGLVLTIDDFGVISFAQGAKEKVARRVVRHLNESFVAGYKRGEVERQRLEAEVLAWRRTAAARLNRIDELERELGR